jgi:hypothetical protein
MKRKRDSFAIARATRQRGNKEKGKLKRQKLINFTLILIIFHPISLPAFCFNFPLSLFLFVDVFAKIGK